MIDESFLMPVKGNAYEILQDETNNFFRCISLQILEVIDRINDLGNTHKKDYYLATITLMLRDVCARVEGISDLFKVSNTSMIPLLLRSLFETFVYFDYIFENRETIEQRALCYHAYTIHSRIANYQRVNSSDPTYKDEQYLLGGEIIGKFNPGEMTSRANNLKNIFTRPPFEAIEKEWIRVCGRKRRFPNWYSLFEGPKNFRELCRHLDLEKYYVTLYYFFSADTHGANAHNGITSSTSGVPEYRPLRLPTTVVADYIDLTLTFAHPTCKHQYCTFFSEDLTSFATWHFKMREQSLYLQQRWKELVKALEAQRT